MSTLLWVIAPLVLLGMFLLLRRLAGHETSRHRANVVLSLVLLVYFLATAGLGIFWVARQQLPVFELHYVFGYVALLLALLHVTLNGHVILRTFSQPYQRRARRTAPTKATEPSQPQPASSTLPRWLACVFLLVGFGIGVFTAGTHCDKASEPAVPSAPSSSALPTDNADIVRRYHELSSESRTNAFTRAPVVAWSKPPPFKQDPENLARIDLPPPTAPDNPRPLESAVTAPPQQLGATLDLPALSSLLHQTCGITLRRAGLALRAAPSSGALFSAEVYVAVRKVDGLEAGLYHYDAEHHRLVRLSAEVPSGMQLGHPAHPALENAPATILVTSIFARTGYKYGHRAYRYILADVGHLLENLRLASSELGYDAKTLTSFDEQRVAQTLSLDRNEGALAVVPLVAGMTEPVFAGTWTPSSSDVSGNPLGPTGAIHEATSLRATLDTEPAPSPDLLKLPALEPSSTTVWDAIQRRRSTRVYADENLKASELGALLSAASRPGSIVSSHVKVWAIAHRVEGVAPGVYRYDARRHALSPVRQEDMKATTQSAVLSQEMAGQAAAVMVLTVDGRAVLKEGPRAYRHAWLEVGMLGERVYLTASARALGVCGAGAFFDDEAAALLNLEDDQWVAHFVAVGRK